MRSYDFSPLWRSTIGFDRLFDLAESAQRATEDHYPPYNIERLGDDRYQISLAVAGFSPEEISVTAEHNVVTIEGSKPEKAEREYLYRRTRLVPVWESRPQRHPEATLRWRLRN